MRRISRPALRHVRVLQSVFSNRGRFAIDPRAGTNPPLRCWRPSGSRHSATRYRRLLRYLGKGAGISVRIGGAGGIRTRYLFNAIEALSRVSYSPTCDVRRWPTRPVRKSYHGAWRCGDGYEAADVVGDRRDRSTEKLRIPGVWS